jgi:hypothetical protein
MNIILVPLFAWLFALAYDWFEKYLIQGKIEPTGKSREIKFSPQIILSIVYVIIFSTQIYFVISREYHKYWDFFAVPRAFKYNVDSSQVSYFYSTMIILLGLGAFLILQLLIDKLPKYITRTNWALGLIFSGFLVFSAIDIGLIGPWFWVFPGTVPHQGRQYQNGPEILRNGFDKPRDNQPLTTISNDETFSVSFVKDWYFERYILFLKKTGEEVEDREKLLGMIDGKRLYFTEKLKYPSIQAYLLAASKHDIDYQIITYTGDKLVLEIDVPQEGYLGFIDNWDPNWALIVDGVSKPIKLLYGTFKAAPLTPGRRLVTFVYCPKYIPFVDPLCRDVNSP